MKKIIVKKEQLEEYIERKQTDKIYYNIMTELHKNMKYLNENISLKKSNQSVIDDYRQKNIINTKVLEMLVKHKIINDNYEIL